LRLHDGRSIQAVPIYLPPDPAIPATEVPPFRDMTRPFEPDKRILQREAVGGSPGLQRAAYAVLGAIGVIWIASLGWGLRRMDRSPGRPTTRPAVHRAAA
jgi:hypothetical protein